MNQLGQPCTICGKNAVYVDRLTGWAICYEHARLEVRAVDEASQDKDNPPLAIRRATPAERETIGLMSLYFWGETDDESFGRTYDVLALPAFVAVNADSEMVGLLSISGDWADGALTLVALGVLPAYQGQGVGRALLATAEGEARRLGLGRLRIETTNDNLPALCLYQRIGFIISRVLPGVALAHHGGEEEPGFAGIPVRDVIQLERSLR
jgi:ribosomal protein S18 acetylase RimI-like enzyme